MTPEIEALIQKVQVGLARSIPSADNGNYSAVTLTIDEAQSLLSALHVGTPAPSGWEPILGRAQEAIDGLLVTTFPDTPEARAVRENAIDVRNELDNLRPLPAPPEGRTR